MSYPGDPRVRKTMFTYLRTEKTRAILPIARIFVLITSFRSRGTPPEKEKRNLSSTKKLQLGILQIGPTPANVSSKRPNPANLHQIFSVKAAQILSKTAALLLGRAQKINPRSTFHAQAALAYKTFSLVSKETEASPQFFQTKN